MKRKCGTWDRSFFFLFEYSPTKYLTQYLGNCQKTLISSPVSQCDINYQYVPALSQHNCYHLTRNSSIVIRSAPHRQNWVGNKPHLDILRMISTRKNACTISDQILASPRSKVILYRS